MAKEVAVLLFFSDPKKKPSRMILHARNAVKLRELFLNLMVQLVVFFLQTRLWKLVFSAALVHLMRDCIIIGVFC